MNIKVVSDSITVSELKKIGAEFYIDMVKGVVDLKKGVVAFGGEFHMDANMVLLKQGSQQEDVWGFNIRFAKDKDEWIEYTSLINIRPAQGNTDMEVHDEKIRSQMKEIINSKIKE